MNQPAYVVHVMRMGSAHVEFDPPIAIAKDDDWMHLVVGADRLLVTASGCIQAPHESPPPFSMRYADKLVGQVAVYVHGPGDAHQFHQLIDSSLTIGPDE